jgi:cysteine-rich repeat protein
MPRYLVLLLVFPFMASAAQITVTIPDTAVADLQQACQRMAVLHHTKIPTNAECGARLIRMGANNLVQEIVRRQGQQDLRDAINAKKAQLAIDFPDPLVPAICGDDEVDSHLGEQCDDGNQIPGDGCDEACRIE